jgi:hypothetical protein
MQYLNPIFIFITVVITWNLVFPQPLSAQKYFGGNGSGYGLFESSDIPIPLPVSYINLNISYKESLVSIFWESSFSKVAQRFEVERKTTDGKWEVVDIVNCDFQCFNNKFGVIDEVIPVVTTYYRVCEYDINENKRYSNIEFIQPFIELESEIQIFPNPVSFFLQIEFDMKESDYVIEIFSCNGNSIIKVENQSIIDCSGIPVGLYFLKIYSQNKNLSTQLIIKQ